MVFCQNCGLENPDSAPVCSNCGSALGVSSAAGAVPSPGAPTPQAIPAAPGMTLSLSSVLRGQYLILKKLAAGGMGAVYLVKDSQLFDRLCVVKEMLPYYTNAAEKAEAESKFEREARLLANLRHPGIPQVYDYFIEQNRYYLVMEFVDGDNLEERLAQSGGPLPEREVIDCVIQVASVLVYIDQQSPPVIHRDIKPANIILDKSTGHAKLVDFGIAREAASTTGPVQSSVLGTPGYSPPEQYAHNTESRSDVFSLGATMHHLLSGLDPRQAPRLFEYPPLSQVVPGISPVLEALVARMLESNPTQRPTAVQLHQELRTLGQPQVAATGGPFAFRSGAMVHDVMELARECDSNWSDGIHHLYNGHLEVWFHGINRHDLAVRAEAIRKQGGNPNAGLEDLLRALNPTMPLPVLNVRPLQLNLGSLEKGDKLSATIEIENGGRGYVHGEAKVLVPWVKVTPVEFGCRQGDQVELDIEIDSGQLAEGSVNAQVLALSSNGGQAVISAQFLVTWQPKPVLDVARLDFGEMMEESLGQQVVASFSITNGGGGLLEGQLDCPSGWVFLNARDFRLLSGQSMEVNAVADTGQLSLAHTRVADIALISTGGNVTLPARISVLKEAYKQRTMRWGIYGIWLLLGVAGWAVASAVGMRLLMGMQPDQVAAASWAGGAAVVSLAALSISRKQVPLLDEIENYYHQGDLQREIPTSGFGLKRVGLVACGLVLSGLLLGVSYNRMRPAAWWALPSGAVAGALLGALLATSGDRTVKLSGVRSLVAGVAMAFLGTLLTANRSATSAMGFTIWWTAAGVALTAGAFPHLSLRLRWLLGHVRPGLLCVLLAYLGWLTGMALLYRTTPPFVAFYGIVPGMRLRVALQYVPIIALAIGGMVLGRWADGSVGANRRQDAQLMLWALVPAMGVGIVGFLLGRIVFGVLSVIPVWRWGVMGTVLAIELALAWLAKHRAQQVTDAWDKVRRAAGSWTSKIALPTAMTGIWSKVQGWLPSAPQGGWLAGLGMTAAIGVAGTATLLSPFITHVVFSLLLWLIVLAIVALVVMTLVRYVRTH